MIKLFVIIVVLLNCTIFNEVEASHLDAYKNILASKAFTLRYHIDPIDYRKDNTEGTISSFGELMPNIEMKPYAFEGKIVIDGDNQYLEKYKWRCVLIKDGECFRWDNDMNTGEAIYFNESVKLSDEVLNGNSYGNIAKPLDYGNPAICKFLGAIFTPDPSKVNVDLPGEYQYKGTGKVDGLVYEDYSAENNDQFYAIRYYFDDDVMKKAAMAYSFTTPTGKEIERMVIYIDEFSPVVDKSCFELPSNLKDIDKLRIR